MPGVGKFIHTTDRRIFRHELLLSMDMLLNVATLFSRIVRTGYLLRLALFFISKIAVKVNYRTMRILCVARQGMNWWLSYMLAQPVDFDLQVIFHFARSYFFTPFFGRINKQQNFSDSVHKNDSIDHLVTH